MDIYLSIFLWQGWVGSSWWNSFSCRPSNSRQDSGPDITKRVCQLLLCSVLGICPKEMFTCMCEELELEASLKLHLHRKENEKLKFNNRRILKGLTHILHMDHGDHSLYMDHGDHTLTLHEPWRSHAHYTCTMEITHPQHQSRIHSSEPTRPL